MIYTLPPIHKDDDYIQYPIYDYKVDLDGDEYRIFLHWRERNRSWFVSIFDGDDEAIVRSRRLAINAMIHQSLPGLMLLDTSDSSTECDYHDLGRRCKMTYMSRQALATLYDELVATQPQLRVT
jgi:hypothetical protein